MCFDWQPLAGTAAPPGGQIGKLVRSEPEELQGQWPKDTAVNININLEYNCIQLYKLIVINCELYEL